MNFRLPAQAPGAYAAVFGAWGMATGELAWGVAAGLALELPSMTGRKLDVDERGFRSAWMLSLFLLWAQAINGWLQMSRSEAVENLLRWMPLVALPVALVSAVATRPGVPLTALLLLLRRRFHRPSVGGVMPPVPRFDPFFPCVWLVLVSTAHQDPGPWYFWLAMLVLSWVFVRAADRGRRSVVVAWLLVTLALGFAGHQGILKLYRMIDHAITGGGRGVIELETSRSITQIGSVGSLKQNPAVRWRVEPVEGQMPGHMVEATFNRFGSNTWFNHGHRTFETLPTERRPDGLADWPLVDSEPQGRVTRARLMGKASHYPTVLARFPGTHRVEALPASRVLRNGLGVVRAEPTLPVVQCELVAASDTLAQPPPSPDFDLDVPVHLEAVLRDIEGRLALHTLSPGEQVEAVEAFFQQDFSYSRSPQGDDLATFLLATREGHCEYFATATVLLLRSAGLPARYNIGYSVQEYDTDGGQWLLRGIHAHAWATAWVDGRWVIVDTTPAAWLEADMARVPLWQPLADWWDEKWLAFEVWRETSDPAAMMGHLAPWLMAVVILYTVVRFLMDRRKRKAGDARAEEGPRYIGGIDGTRWAKLVPRVEAVEGARPPWLPAAHWIESLNHRPDGWRSAAHHVLADHNRQRFGPAGDAVGKDEPQLDQAVRILEEGLSGREMAG